MAVTMDDSRIVEAHQHAAKLALKELEQFAGTRIRKNGADQDRGTGNLVGASFLHNSSRALDPQLHTHFTLFNCTWDKSEKRWKALQTSGMFGAIHYATEVYRNDLRRQLHELGYATRKTANGFEIEGVAPKIITRFSKRAQERAAMVSKLEQELGRKLSNNEVSHAVHKTRSRKLKGISSDDVRQRQLDQIGLLEKMALNRVRSAADGSARPFEERIEPPQALDHATAHVFERNSVAPQHELLHAALVKGCGQLNLEQLKEKVQEHSAFVRVGEQYSTRQILETELYLINSMNRGKGAMPPLNKSYQASSFLGPDQQRAVELILRSRDQFTGLRGLAGTGKTKTLQELNAGVSSAGFEAVFCAPTAAAADVLRKDGFSSAVTLQKLLIDPETQRRVNDRSVLVLDEAGAVGIEDMAKLFDLAKTSRCRVVLSGDTGQHSSVPRGDALRLLEQHSRYQFGQLSTIRRQLRGDYLQVVELAANKKPEAAFERLKEMNAVTEAPSIGPKAKLYESAAAAYLESVNQGKSALLVSPTWNEIEAVTEQARHTLKAQARLGSDEHSVTVLDSLAWTDAQKKNVHQYEPGQKILFLRDSGAFAKNETVEVVSVGKSTLRLRRDDGSEVSFAPKVSGSACDVCQSRELKVSPGEKLLLQANDRKSKLINGEIVEVQEIHGGEIRLADGRSLPKEYRRFCHGYAVTSHASQGKTVDDVFLVASSHSFRAVNREQFYVSISRGRERCHVFTDDSELLQRRIADSHERTAAVELLELREALKREGFTPRHDTRPVAVRKDQTAKEKMTRRSLRPTRPTRQRLSVAQRLSKIAQDFQDWTQRQNPIEPPRQQKVGRGTASRGMSI